MSKKIADAVDLRTLPKDKRPKPTSGQSREPFQLAWDELSPAEQKIVKALNGAGEGRRETRSIGDLAKSTRFSLLQVRNSLRRLVPSKWAERVETTIDDAGSEVACRGCYRVTEAGRKRAATALSN